MPLIRQAMEHGPCAGVGRGGTRSRTLSRACGVDTAYRRLTGEILARKNRRSLSGEPATLLGLIVQLDPRSTTFRQVRAYALMPVPHAVAHPSKAAGHVGPVRPDAASGGSRTAAANRGAGRSTAKAPVCTAPNAARTAWRRQAYAGGGSSSW
jgi:hypothetical protein